MRRRLQWFIRLRAHGLRKGDEHSSYTPARGMRQFIIIHLRPSSAARPALGLAHYVEW